MATRTKPAILQSSLQFVTVGTITQLIGRDILGNADVTLATIDNRAFDEKWFSDDWRATAKILGFTLIGAPAHSKKPPMHRREPMREILGALVSLAIVLALKIIGVIK